MRTVIVTAIGSFSADIVIKKCRENGIRVIGCDVYPREWIADAGNVEVFYQVPYATDTDHYIGTTPSGQKEFWLLRIQNGTRNRIKSCVRMT